MSEPNLEVILNSSGGEVECFLDPDNEVFFGPVTEREREIRRPLPRKTLHPCEIIEISKRGMNFQEWEAYKDQVHRNEMNDEAIKDVYGLNSSITEDSFTSCITVDDDDEPQKAGIVKVENQDSSIEQESPRQSPQELSGVESLNDTWEIQERMLALAEKLERGEEIPELGITRHPSGKIEYTEIADVTTDSKMGVRHSNPRSAKMVKCEPSEEVVKCEPLEEVCLKQENVDGENPYASFKSPRLAVVYDQRKTPSVEDLAKEMDCLFLAQTLVETPVKPSTPKTIGRLTPSSMRNARSSPRVVSDTPMKTPNGLGIKHRSTPIQKPTPLKKPITKASSSKNVLPTASPVGMYIRSLPEPILIENVRSAQKKKQISSSPMMKPPTVAIKNSDGRWSIARTPRTSSTATSSKENFLPPTDLVPVLPTVLHEAAGTLIDEGKITSSPSTPGTRGKIGKLLERGITPTVMKHQGRIQIAKDTANSARVIHSPVSAKSAQKTSSLMEVSVLEAVRVTKSYTPLKNPNRK